MNSNFAKAFTVATIVIVAVLLVWGGIVYLNRYLNHASGIMCVRKGAERSVSAKYVDQGYDRWVCLMKLPDGHWVPDYDFNGDLKDYYLYPRSVPSVMGK